MSKRWQPVALVVLVIAAVAACAPPAPPQKTYWEPGTYRVGVDIQPGRYMTESDHYVDEAYRQDANGQRIGGTWADRLLLDVQPTDAYVEVVDGLLVPWAVRHVSTMGTTDGMWIVGTEMALGTWAGITPFQEAAWWGLYADTEHEVVLDPGQYVEPSGRVQFTVTAAQTGMIADVHFMYESLTP